MRMSWVAKAAFCGDKSGNAEENGLAPQHLTRPQFCLRATKAYLIPV